MTMSPLTVRASTRHGATLQALLLCSVMASGQAAAATFCVTNATELQAALNTAASNGQNDTIRIRRGAYLAPSGPTGFNYFSSENSSLTIEGGWFGVTAGTCSIRVDDAEDTILDGQGQRSVMRLLGNVNSGASFTVRNLTIRNGDGTSQGTDFGGLQVTGLPLLGDITIDRVIFRNNHSESIGGGLRAQSLGVVRVINSLFDGNSCDAYYCAADVFASAPTGSAGQPRLLFLGNTVVRTGCSGENCGLGQVSIGAGTDFPTQYLVGNSVFALNTGVDVSFSATTGTLRNSRWDTRLGTPQSLLSNLAPGTPPGFFDAALGDFRLTPGSALVDAGFLFPQLPEFDLDGANRLAGPFVDIGAYELQPDPNAVHKDGFESP